jgi:hypothetical protein
VRNDQTQQSGLKNICEAKFNSKLRLIYFYATNYYFRMRIIKRRIIIKGVQYDIWLGLTTKVEARRSTYQLYYYTADPDDKMNKPILIKRGFQSEKVAIEYGKTFMKDLLTQLLNR